ncbi:nicotinamide/nicotinic acid mononucleotide adenylyltransferase isoform X3 [Amaranthus tricolor]|uniref:nicotinamide/nicotinic acid mononucleotide adenylyltransferase isoform X3 n=1 Tax=Amaranthus tricolor TaxID=29722 RepID=UPI00258DE54A|nr:nicotinamide/nicotinic acid mononucleotide adenylyltransferase isoform X3 [Amaranthus tricolor]XP_057533644.1 nicotinamide/nicotinic acid mononucleotide adenylyltransferase isoform X3 [Amaranthus tricolor]XP_057533645.1 nicotinamide/nicotinic acid mononucleotide adenylyltransferase isoform X3 [Amaranthus tricolor]XP_057533646.1 nicotinamide/nicotinic acid mononucleotide adenylyltransferase isoform X3 [Amaranthus tricolor]XP_057533647.1 nicotinamide/nicotinic acid mononucleotide adenylyltrans
MFLRQVNLKLARDALNLEGYTVIGAYLSPVNDAYKKKGLVSADHRIQMCQLACKSSDFIMVDTWEAKQVSYQRTLTILSRVKSFICENSCVSAGKSFTSSTLNYKALKFIDKCTFISCDTNIFYTESLRVMLVCGSDLLESFGVPGVWIPEQVRSICRDFGVACIRREGQDVEKIISSNDILNDNKRNIKIVDELISNQISSTRIRDCITRGLSVKYLTSDEVIDYIQKQELYLH